MSDAISFLLILPALVLGMAVLDAAGTLGAARYRTSTLAEAIAVHAAETLADSPPAGADPSARSRWDEVNTIVKQSGLAATAGVCNQTDGSFEVSLLSQPRASQPPDSPSSVAVVVSCPVELSQLLQTNRIVSVSVESVE